MTISSPATFPYKKVYTHEWLWSRYYGAHLQQLKIDSVINKCYSHKHINDIWYRYMHSQTMTLRVIFSCWYDKFTETLLYSQNSMSVSGRHAGLRNNRMFTWCYYYDIMTSSWTLFSFCRQKFWKRGSRRDVSVCSNRCRLSLRKFYQPSTTELTQICPALLSLIFLYLPPSWVSSCFHSVLSVEKKYARLWWWKYIHGGTLLF